MTPIALLLTLLPALLHAQEACTHKNHTRYCLADEATCIDGHCTCIQEGHTGNGYLSCEHSTEHACYLINDPTLQTFSQEKVELPVPCRYHAAQFVVKEPTQGDGEWKCSALVSGFNERIRGKIFVGGFDVKVIYIHESEGERTFWLRAKGNFNNATQTYEFEREVKKPSSAVWETMQGGDSTFLLDFLPFEHELSFEISEVNKRLELQIPFCALRVFFRPANPNLGGNQTHIPGLSILVSDEVHDIRWTHSPQSTSCMKPGSKAKIVENLLKLPIEHAFILQAFENTDTQIFPGASPECLNIRNVVTKCTNDAARREAMRVCSFTLTNPNFVYCWEGDNSLTDSYIVLELFKVCFNAFCQSNEDECVKVRDQVDAHKCGSKADRALLDHTCDLR